MYVSIYLALCFHGFNQVWIESIQRKKDAHFFLITIP